LEATTVADPLLPPKQLTFVEALITTVGFAAFGTVTVAERVHPFASVMVTVYVFAKRPVAVDAFPPLGAQE
jgi:hypothetical protein